MAQENFKLEPAAIISADAAVYSLLVSPATGEIIALQRSGKQCPRAGKTARGGAKMKVRKSDGYPRSDSR